jgi:hypothetical protein
MDKINIYTLHCNHNIGRITQNSLKVSQPVCSECNRTILKEIKYSHVEFEFDEYNGEDMFFSMGCLIVSEKLFYSLETIKIKGFAPIKVKNKKSKYFKGDFKSIKTFIYLAIFPPEVKNVPIAYKFKEVCNFCGNNKVDFTTTNLDLMYRETDKNQECLKTYYDSWNGNDIFNFVDHTEIGVTEKFLQVLKDFKCPNNIIIPGEWI